jgi:hypothetical protein
LTPRRILIAAPIVVALAAALPVLPAGAGAGSSIDVTASPSLERDIASFDLDYEETGQDACIGAPTGEAFEEGMANAVDATFSLADGGGFVSFGPGVPSGYYDLVLTCDIGDDVISGSTTVAFARGYVVKEVEGDVPADAEFVIDLTCAGEDDEGEPTAAAPFSLTFTYPSAGGQEGFVVYSEQDCTVTETEDGGAVETTVEGTFAFPAPADETVTVTNTFADAVTPPTPHAPPAPPAVQPVVAAPAYTG